MLVVTAVQRTCRLAQTDRTLQLGLLLLDISGQELQYTPTDIGNLRLLSQTQTGDRLLQSTDILLPTVLCPLTLNCGNLVLQLLDPILFAFVLAHCYDQGLEPLNSFVRCI